jgi:hypothetical protein
MIPSAQLVGEAVTLLKVSVLFPCALPNPEPFTLTTVPATPEVGVTELMAGAAREKLTVVVFVAETRFPVFVTGGYPVGERETS